MSSLDFSDSFKYLCYGFTAIRIICTLTVRGSTLVVRIWRLQSSESDYVYRRQILMTKVDPCPVRVFVAKISLSKPTL